jgi:protocatechuate 3,4-dioxygenase beta subunit
MKKTIALLVVFFSFTSILLWSSCSGQVKENNKTEANTQTKKIIGGGCDGCELMYEGMPKNISSVDTSDGWFEAGEKLLVTGIVMNLDGKTPAKDVIIYYWQTDNNGYYSPSKDMNKNAIRHGHIRGWVKSDAQGRYSIYTIRPMPYPNDNIPAHIHISIKEPGMANEYYTDDLVFDDDKKLTGAERKKLPNRGGSGVLRIVNVNGIQVAEHNFILGLNIPNYPSSKIAGITSGLQVGEDNPSFIPYHAWGPDKGTRTCPVCKYGRYQGILYFAGEKESREDIENWLSFLEQQSIERDRYLKAYFVYGNENDFSKTKRQAELEKIGQKLNIHKMALTYVPSFNDQETEVFLNKVNPAAYNTIVIYRNSNIIANYVNLKPTIENFNELTSFLDKTKSAYADYAANKPD